MREYVTLASAPIHEDCVQVNSKSDYIPAMRAECERFKDLLEQVFPDYHEYGYFIIKSNPHDFGTYLEVVFKFDDNDIGWAYATHVENNLPTTWDDTTVRVFEVPTKEEPEEVHHFKVEYTEFSPQGGKVNKQTGSMKVHATDKHLALKYFLDYVKEHSPECQYIVDNVTYQFMGI